MAAMFRKKRFKFDVTFCVEALQDVPFITGVIFAKVRLLSGGKYVKQSERRAIEHHRVEWKETCNFQAEIPSNPATGILEPCICRVSVRKEVKGGKSYNKLGFVDVNLSQFAGTGVIGKSRSYILEGYDRGSGRSRQDNSLLMLHIGMQLLSSDPFFKAPTEFTTTSHELNHPSFNSSAGTLSADSTLRRADTADGIDSASKKAPSSASAITAAAAAKSTGIGELCYDDDEDADDVETYRDDVSRPPHLQSGGGGGGGTYCDDSTAAVIMSPDPTSCHSGSGGGSNMVVHWHQHPRIIQTTSSDRHQKMHRASDPDLFRHHHDRIVESPASSESSSGCGSLRNYRTSGSDSGGGNPHRPGHSRNASSASQQSASHILGHLGGGLGGAGGLHPPPSAGHVQTHSRHSSTESGQGGGGSGVWNITGHGGTVVGLRKMSADHYCADRPGSGSGFGTGALNTPGGGCPPGPGGGGQKLSSSSGGSSAGGGSGCSTASDPRKRFSQESVNSRIDKSRLDPTEVIDELVGGLSSLSEEMNDTSGLHLSHLT